MVHAMAGEAWSRAHGGADRGMLASEIAEAIPGLFREVSPSPPSGVGDSGRAAFAGAARAKSKSLRRLR